MLQPGFTAVLQSRTRDEFQAEVVGFAKWLGFETVAATMVIDHLQGEPEIIAVDNAPEGGRSALSRSDRWQSDPVARHCVRHSVPIIWDQATYLAGGRGDLWDEMARRGSCNGIALGLHMPEGRHFVLGVDRAAPVPHDPVELTRMVADLQLFAVHANDAAARILVPSMGAGVAPLTPREIESLRWTMEGKTAWEVGALLGISERTAVLHVNNATHKLGCVNKHQAVLKALRLGLIR
jgi:DNA-binding CsgD family transcriptional regulator